jgi:uncharacterized protein YgbK (DUF1537 family)
MLRLAFYGDDFTGSTDALEVLAFAGLRCALFLQVPDESTLSELGPFDAIGVAGASRAMSPAEMDEQLAPVLSAMSKLPVRLVHYKVCSTFDSSPSIGSIGRVMDLSRASFGQGAVPVVAATPALGRYCAFGNLFARSGTDGRVYRIDRHPIMSVHPVTPMHEADLVRHLGEQTAMPIASFTLPQLAAGVAAADTELERLDATMTGGAVLFDGMTADELTATGRMLDGLSNRRATPLFCVGGSGLEYALTQWWRVAGVLPEPTGAQDSFDGVPQVLAVSGSASPLSALQIDAALAAGFVDVPVDAAASVASNGWGQELARLADQALASLRAGHSVMLHSARGPQGPTNRRDADHPGGARHGPRAGPSRRRSSAGPASRRVGRHRVACASPSAPAPVWRRHLQPGHAAPRPGCAPHRRTARARCAAVPRAVPRAASLQISRSRSRAARWGSPDYFIRALRGTADARQPLL